MTQPGVLNKIYDKYIYWAGGLYLTAPVRLCSYYRLDQQAEAGWWLLAVAVTLGLLWFAAAFVGWPRPACPPPPHAA